MENVQVMKNAVKVSEGNTQVPYVKILNFALINFSTHSFILLEEHMQLDTGLEKKKKRYR